MEVNGLRIVSSLITAELAILLTSQTLLGTLSPLPAFPEIIHTSHAPSVRDGCGYIVDEDMSDSFIGLIDVGALLW